MGFTLLLSLATGILFGLVPAMQASRADLNITLKETGARGGSGMRQNKARGLLVMVEMALAMVLLVGAGLLIRTFSALHSVAPGFDPHNVLTMDTALTGSRYDRTAAIRPDDAPGARPHSRDPRRGGRGGYFLSAARGRAGAGIHH